MIPHLMMTNIFAKVIQKNLIETFIKVLTNKYISRNFKNFKLNQTNTLKLFPSKSKQKFQKTKRYIIRHTNNRKLPKRPIYITQ